MTKTSISEKRMKRVNANPFYVIQIHQLFRTQECPKLISKKRWVSTNERMISEIGVKAWLLLLLESLEGKYLSK